MRKSEKKLHKQDPKNLACFLPRDEFAKTVFNEFQDKRKKSLQ